MTVLIMQANIYVVLWRNLHCWQKIYTVDGSAGRDKSHLWLGTTRVYIMYENILKTPQRFFWASVSPISIRVSVCNRQFLTQITEIGFGIVNGIRYWLGGGQLGTPLEDTRGLGGIPWVLASSRWFLVQAFLNTTRPLMEFPTLQHTHTCGQRREMDSVRETKWGTPVGGYRVMRECKVPPRSVSWQLRLSSASATQTQSSH